VRLHEGGVYSGDRRLILGAERSDHEIHELMHEAKSGLVAHLEAFAGNTIEFIRSESPLLIDGIGIPDIDVDMNRRHVVIVAEEPSSAADLKALKPFIKEYQPVLVGVGTGADVLRKAGYRPQLIVGDPDRISAEALRCGAQVVLPADADGHAAGLERIQDLGVGAMTFPAAGSAADLALLLCDHHGASLIVTAGHSASIEEFFDRSRQQSNPSTFLTRLKVGEKLVDARAVATLYRSRVSGGAIALLVLAMLVAVIVALWVSRADVRCSTGSSTTGTGSRCGFRAGSPRRCDDFLRTHAISLAAVFLALAIGSRWAPAAVQHVLSGLRDDKTRTAEPDQHAHRRQERANEKLSAAGEFDAQMSPRICATR
jgi:uncharacterized membrane-anchored protein